MGMLPPTMDNDLAEVDRLIREYWGMAPIVERREDGTDQGDRG
jgi:hypothetical protein